MEYVLGFDFNRNMVRLLTLDGGSVRYEELPTHKSLTARGDYSGMLKFAFRDRSLGGAAVRVALPDTAVACDFFTIPNIKKQTKNAMKVEFENIYTNHEQLKYNAAEYNSGKLYTTDMYVMTRKSVLDSVKEGVEAIGGTLKGVTSSPNGVVNAFFALGGKETSVTGMSGGGTMAANLGGISLFKKKKDAKKPDKEEKEPKPLTALFVDVQPDMTRLVLASKSMTMCSLYQPFGYHMLYSNKVVQEYMITNHDVAELAVLNAIETAKRKKQTVAIASDVSDDDGDAEADDSYMDLLESLTNKDAAPVPRKKQEAAAEADEYGEESEQKTDAAPVSNEPKPFDKIAKKQEKKYPKFMLRDKPADAQGYVMENFRTIQKYILLFVQNMESSSVFAPPERVVINLPPEFSFIPAKLNEEEDNGVEFVLLENGGNQGVEVMDNLDLYGATLMDKYNKEHNF